MVRLTRIVAISAIAAGLTLAGCNKDSGTPDSGPPDSGPPDSGTPSRGTPDSGNPPPSSGANPDNHGAARGGARALGSVTVGASTLDVSIGGAMTPNATVAVDLQHTGGPIPAVVRLWIGEASGAGSLKSKAAGHGDHFHGSVEVPAEIGAEGALWIEAESASGERVAKSLPLS